MYQTLFCGGSAADDGSVLLRNDASEFTPAELEALCRVELSEDGGGRDREDDGGVDTDDEKVTAAVKTRQKVFSFMGDDRRRCFSLRQLLPREELVGGTDGIADAVLNTSQLHVENRALHDTSLLECFLHLTHLYMQHNHVKSLEGLSLLAQLTVLVVHHNAVTTLRPLAGLPALMFLDARFNAIALLDPSSDLPHASLRYLSLLSNPCCRSESTVTAERESYRRGILECCPLLEVLDEVSCLSSSSSSLSGDEDAEEKDDDAEATVPLGAPQRLPDAQPELRIASSRLSQLRNMRKAASRRFSPSASSATPLGSKDVITTTARLCDQFQHRSESIRRMAGDHAFKLPNAEAVGGEGDHFKANDSEGDDGCDGGGALPSTLIRERETKSRLYSDIRFALNMESERAQQLVGGVWEDVDKVVRTRQALVGHRRERMEAQRQQPSEAYAESLFLLQKENHTTDLSKYRK